MANIDQLLAYPIIKELEYRSNINSKDLNLMLKSIEESILRSIIRGTETENKIKMLNLATNAAYSSIGMVNQIYNYAPKPFDIPSGEFGGVAFATAFGDVSGVRQEKLTGIVTMDWNNNKKLSKIPVYNGVVSQAIQIYVDGTLRPNNDSVYNIIDGDPATFWVEETVPGEHTLELILPPSTRNSFNYIEVIPFPIFGIEIVKIEYSDFQSINHSIFPTKDNSFYNNKGPLILHLSPREFNNTIKITFNVINGINVMGFTHIDISSIDYLNNTNTIYLKFEGIPSLDHNGIPLTSIKPYSISVDFYADGVIDKNYNSFISEISIVSTTGNNPISQLGVKKLREFQRINIANSSFNVVQGTDVPNALFLKVVMNEVNLTTPVIRGAQLNYREIM